jgi:protein O-mannosyl-transferase
MTSSQQPAECGGCETTTLPLFDRIRSAALSALPFVLLAGLAVGLYFPSLGGGFVYDSRLQILTDSFIHDPSHWRDVLTLHVMGMDVLDSNRPVQLASLMADASLWGRDPFGYRLTNILLHALNGCLLFSVLRRLPGCGARESRDRWAALPAMLASALFLVHPLAVEVVCEPSNREDLLATAFVLCVLMSAMRITENGRGWLAAVCASVFTFLALGSKETGVAAPVLFGTYIFLFPGKTSLRQRILLASGPCLVTILFLSLRFFIQPAESVIFGSKPGYPGDSLAAAMSIQPRIFALYLTNIFHPTNLCADYGLYSVRNLPLSLSLWIVGLATAGLAAGCWKDRRILLAASGILVALLPVSNIFPIYCAAADRFLYLPLALGAIVPLCLMKAELIRRHASLRLLVFAIAGAAVLLLAGINKKVQALWLDAESLFSACVERNPFSIGCQVGLAEALLRDRNWSAAKARYLLIIQMPEGRDCADAWAGLALCDDAQGDRAGAGKAAGEALRLDPCFASEEKMLRGIRCEAEFARAFSCLVARCHLNFPLE